MFCFDMSIESGIREILFTTTTNEISACFVLFGSSFIFDVEKFFISGLLSLFFGYFSVRIEEELLKLRGGSNRKFTETSL